MSGGSVGNIALAIVYVALATTLVMHPGTAKDITAASNGFAHSIDVAVRG